MTKPQTDVWPLGRDNPSCICDDVPNVNCPVHVKVIPPPQTEQKMEEMLEACPNCGGDGFTAEHDPSDPHENGCNFSCPVQVQCERCHANGYFIDKTKLQALLTASNREAVKNKLTELVQAGNEFGAKSGSLEAGWAHIRDLLQAELRKLGE